MLEKGGRAGYVVIGWYENCNFHSILLDTCKKYKIDISAWMKPFRLSNPADLKKDFKEAGFIDVWHYFTPMNVGIFDWEAYLKIQLGLQPLIQHLSPED